MSKGSNRRPSQIPDKQLADNWERIFNKDKACNLMPVSKGVKDVFNKTMTELGSDKRIGDI